MRDNTGALLTPYSKFKKDMRDFFNTSVDAEDGETFKDWFGALMDAIEEEKNVVIIRGKKYIRG